MTILTCKQSVECIFLQIFLNNQILKSQGYTNPPDLPTLKAYPTPGGGGRLKFFSQKWGEKMNLKVYGAILPFYPLAAGFEHRGENCKGVVATPFWRTRINGATQLKVLFAHPRHEHDFAYWIWCRIWCQRTKELDALKASVKRV